MAAVEALHERLGYECSGVGVLAIYQGALAEQRWEGITPTFYPGRWDVYPLEKVFRDGNLAPHLALLSDRLFSLQVAQAPPDGAVVLTVEGERLAVLVDGASPTWRFPRSPKTTLGALLEACSDRSWVGPPRTRAELKLKGS